MVSVATSMITAEELPVILDRVRSNLAAARTSAEVLEARNMAAAAYDAASRMTRKKAAYDHMTALSMRMQAEALKIEARAKERLADEYDAAQERGEVKRNGGDRSSVEDRNTASAADLGLRRDEIHEARRLRDAERAEPGAIERSVNAALSRGEAPTRASLKRDLGLAPARSPQPDPVAAMVAHFRQWLAAVPPELVAFYAGFAADDEQFRRALTAALSRLNEEERRSLSLVSSALARIAEEITHEA